MVAVKDMEDDPVSGAVFSLGTDTETMGADGTATFTVDGDYSDIRASGTGSEAITNRSMADHTFKDQSGDELQLASGTNVPIDIPVFEGGSIGGLDGLAEGDELPMWYYDFEAETWRERNQKRHCHPSHCRRREQIGLARQCQSLYPMERGCIPSVRHAGYK